MEAEDLLVGRLRRVKESVGYYTNDTVLILRIFLYVNEKIYVMIWKSEIGRIFATYCYHP